MSQPLLFLLMVMTTYRIGRFFKYDRVPLGRLRYYVWLRATRRRGAEVEKDYLYEWWICHWCHSLWIAAVVVALLDAFFISLPLPVLWWFATACGSALIGENLDT